MGRRAGPFIPLSIQAMPLGFKKLLLLALLLLPAFSAALGGKFCFTDKELMAEVAIEYLIEREYAAVICEPIFRRLEETPPVSIRTMGKDIAKKFSLQFSRYLTIREKRFRRLFKRKWEVALARDRFMKAGRIHRTNPLGIESCKELLREMEITFGKNWNYLMRQLDRVIERERPERDMCTMPRRRFARPARKPVEGSAVKESSKPAGSSLTPAVLPR